jgi:hypothetical protein
MMRKEPPKNSTKDRFLVIHRHLIVTTETQEDSSIIKTYLATTKPNNQATKVDVRGSSREKRVCKKLAKIQHMYVRVVPWLWKQANIK